MVIHFISNHSAVFPKEHSVITDDYLVKIARGVLILLFFVFHCIAWTPAFTEIFFLPSQKGESAWLTHFLDRLILDSETAWSAHIHWTWLQLVAPPSSSWLTSHGTTPSLHHLLCILLERCWYSHCKYCTITHSICAENESLFDHIAQNNKNNN